MTTSSLWHKNTLRELLLFGIVGGIQYVVDVAVFSGLVLWTGLPIACNLTSRAAGATCGYYLNGVFTFRVLGRRREGFGARFVIAWLITTAVSTGLIKSLSLLSEVVENPVLLVYGKAVVELLLFVVGFLLCKLWVFVPREQNAPDARGSAVAEVPAEPAAGPRGTGRGTLFVLAHTDDEFFFSPSIRRAVAAGNAVYCAFTTDGTGQGVSPEIRKRESTKALRRLGVSEKNLLFVGLEAGIPDGAAHTRVADVYDALKRTVHDLPLDEIYVPAWEGGHADHDAGHLAGVALARSLGVARVYECPGYHRHTKFFPFRVMTWIPRAATTARYRFGFVEGLFYFSLCACHRSQWKTWLGLGPEAFVRLVVCRRHEYRSVTGIDYTRPPHAGPLLYEHRFGVSFAEFREATAAFIAEHLSWF
ncbi:MAG: PIG-L family deacetylase [Phycisphaerae bacterium]|nr:PIG-L family deacetylase [Phycisphaerae bacterium]